PADVKVLSAERPLHVGLTIELPVVHMCSPALETCWCQSGRLNSLGTGPVPARPPIAARLGPRLKRPTNDVGCRHLVSERAAPTGIHLGCNLMALAVEDGQSRSVAELTHRSVDDGAQSSREHADVWLIEHPMMITGDIVHFEALLGDISPSVIH